jgi:hypothetical protein
MRIIASRNYKCNKNKSKRCCQKTLKIKNPVDLLAIWRNKPQARNRKRYMIVTSLQPKASIAALSRDTGLHIALG